MPLHCPNCHSTQLAVLLDGETNPLLEKGIHLFAGIIKNNSIVLTCRSCGLVFRPGEGIADKTTETLTGDDIDPLLLETIKARGLLEAIKSYKALTGVKLGEARQKVVAVAKKNGIEVTTKTPAGCYVIAMIVLLVLAGIIAGIIKAFK